MRHTILTLLLLVASCGDDASPTSATVDTDALIARTAEAMDRLEYAAYSIEVAGAPITIEGLEFFRADGDYAAPDSSLATLRVGAGGLTVELITISISDRTWLTEPLTGAWTEIDSGEGFNPAIVFGEQGWGPLLLDDLSNAAAVTSSDGYTLSGTVAAERVSILTAGLVADQQIEIAMRIDGSHRIVAADFTTTDIAGTTDWRIEMGPFDQPLTIEPPTG